MPTDKDIKKEFKAKASKEPDKYYATGVLKEEGFSRNKCQKCQTYFWSVEESNFCGAPECSGGFRFIENSPAKKEMGYIEVWQEFARLFKKLGYTPIDRYPVVARWRQDTDFVQASIYDFQPYVVSGEVMPPANPLVVPQVSLRFNDIDNIGITGAHYCAFVMIGQHAFMPPEKWDQAKYFSDIYAWLNSGLGLRKNEITFHEDAWAGGGNFGPCMEFFSRGLELGNQVYMMYELTPSGYKELNLKVLDMGMGHERNAWFSKGTSTSYETTFPSVMKRLYSSTGIKLDSNLMKKFLPYSSYLNIDEVENIDLAWKTVAGKVGIDTKELKSAVLPLAALYSVAEHSRALLFALNDGALPSNVGGGYNLRVILRRALSFIDQYKWDLNLPEMCEWHAEFLKPLFPELTENLTDVRKILDVEKTKYEATKHKSRQIVSKMIKEEINDKELLMLYDSQGISPEIIRAEAGKLGKNVIIPENFYSMVASLHEKNEQEHATIREEKMDLAGIPETKPLFFDDYSFIKFKAKIIKAIDNKVILDRTAFYPTSGGQLHDIGIISHEKVVDVFKQGNVILHTVAGNHDFKPGDEVECEVDMLRRRQLSQHHTSTHIVNAAARRVLGNHVYQAGAKKTEEKAHLDITHYSSLSDDELKKVEAEANKIVNQDIPIKMSFMPRSEAEKKYGMSLYQGGAVPGRDIRVVEIPSVDVEACGGTHLKKTSEAGEIKILKSAKIQDGVVRITFVAGNASNKEKHEEKINLDTTAKLVGTAYIAEIPAKAEALFKDWKDIVKKGKIITLTYTNANEKFDGNILEETAKRLRTQPENINKTISRFLKEIDEKKAN